MFKKKLLLQAGNNACYPKNKEDRDNTAAKYVFLANYIAKAVVRVLPIRLTKVSNIVLDRLNSINKLNDEYETKLEIFFLNIAKVVETNNIELAMVFNNSTSCKKLN